MYHNGEKQTINSSERDYQMKLRQARAQADGNPFVGGVQTVMNEGIGKAIAADRTRYGNSNIMPNELLQGANSNFSIQDSPGNMPLENPINATGSAQLKESSTLQPQVDPEKMETEALDRRLRMYANAAGNASANLNGSDRRM